MLQTIFIVPLFSAALFLIFGNMGRQKIIFALPFVSLLLIFIAFGWPVLAASLILALPAFFMKEVLRLRASRSLFWLCVVSVTLFFMLQKNYFGTGNTLLERADLERWKVLLGTVGLSFLVFRVVEYLLVNVDAKNVPKLPLWGRLHRYLCFCLAFPAFASGPILRWRGYLKDYAGDAPLFEDRSELHGVLGRVANGFVKISLLSQPMFLIVLGLASILNGMGGQDTLSFKEFVFIGCACAFYVHYLYLNFSAYSDIMIGAGRFVGLRLPENFDRPFSSKGFLDFWNHWHLSVSHWFRDILFNPIVKTMMKRGVKSNTLCSITAFVCIFGLLGLWHGRTWPFILCGLMLALGALVNQSYRDLLRKKVEKALPKGTFPHHLVFQFLRAFSYFYIALAVMGLWLKSDIIAKYWTQIASPNGIASIVVVCFLYTVVITLVERFFAILPIKRPEILRLWQSKNIIVNALKITAGILAWVWFSLDTENVFVYEGF